MNGRQYYPENWEELRTQVLERATDRCEGCGAVAGQPDARTGKPVVLQVAHMFENDLATQDIGRLRALCAACHATYDKQMRGRHRSENRKRQGPPAAFAAQGTYQYPLHVGFWVAIVTLSPQTCYVGQIEAVDDMAIRVTLVDWLLGSAAGHDFVVPWSNVAFKRTCLRTDGVRGGHVETDAAEVLADLERLALAGLRHETERLEAAQRAEQKRERDEGPKGASVISPVSAVRMSCLDALELWGRAHDARVQAEEEAQAQNPEEGAGR